jgi:hypothetical protein
MNQSRSTTTRATSLAASVALIAGSLFAATALATPANPQPITAGQSGLSVPVYGSTASNYLVKPTGTGLAYCFNGACSAGSLTLEDIATMFSSGDGGFLEVAGTTNLNPIGGSSDVTLAFVFGGAAANGVTSVTVPGLSTWSTDVQACEPTNSGTLPCPSADSGADAARDSLGDITFSATSTAGLPTNTLDLITLTDVYGIYTGAPISKLGPDPTVLVTYSNGTTAEFAGLSLLAPSSTGPTVPEPSTLALLALGLAGLWLGASRRRRIR